jgi:nucleoside-diphosphate-sugar epimerase
MVDPPDGKGVTCRFGRLFRRAAWSGMRVRLTPTSRWPSSSPRRAWVIPRPACGAESPSTTASCTFANAENQRPTGGATPVVASTSEVYGKNGHSALTETADRVLGPTTVARWAYSTAKAVDEILALTYHRERGLPAVVTRLFNTVGPRQSAAYGMVIPTLVKQALLGQSLTVFGDGQQSRCFCHVTDTVNGLLRVLDNRRAVGSVFNIGSTEEITILELAKAIVEKTGSSSEIQLVPYDEAYQEGFEDMRRRLPDVSKIEALTGWRPRRTLQDILADTIADVQWELGQYADADQIGGGNDLMASSASL